MHEKLRTVIRRLRALAEEFADDRVLANLDAAERRLVETTFKLVVLGEYKRGKSTLINALLASPVLPMGVVPLTSVIAEVRYGSAISAMIRFGDGREQTINATELPAYITEPENPGNLKNVDRALVWHPAPFLRLGVTVVDTPGIGSVFVHNSKITFQSLEEADAVVIVLAADQPLSAEEQGLLRALEGITDRVLFAVNRMDVLTAEDRPVSLQFIRQTLEVLEGRPPDLVFPLAARLALEAKVSGTNLPCDFADFEKALKRVLIDRKSEILASRARTIARSAEEILAIRVGAEREALGFAVEDLDRAVSLFEGAATSIERKLDEAGVLLKHEAEQIHGVHLERLADATRRRIRAEIWPRVEAAMRSQRDSPLRRLFVELSDNIGRWVVEELQSYYRESEVLVRSSLDRALDAHATRVQQTTGEFIEYANRILGMRTEVPSAVAPLREDPRFFFRAWGGAGGAILGHDWWLRWPRRWAEGRAVRELGELLDRRIHQNIGAIRNDWMTRLADAVRHFETSSREQALALVRAVNEALVRARERRMDSADAHALRIAQIDQALASLLSAERELESIEHVKTT